MNKDAVVALVFWIAYNELVTFVASLWLGWNWLYLQPFVILVSVLLVALTFGSQTKPDRNWNEND
jgi:fatty acid desaturase